MKNKILNGVSVLAFLAYMGAAKTASAQNFLEDEPAGIFTLKADIGYIYNFSGGWLKSGGNNPGMQTSIAESSFGYGGSFAYTHNSGFALSMDYLGFNHKWVGTVGNSPDQHSYNAAYHVITLTPSYLIPLDEKGIWGMRLGLGLGIGISDISWAGLDETTNNQTGLAGGAWYNIIDDGALPNEFASCADVITKYFVDTLGYDNSFVTLDTGYFSDTTYCYYENIDLMIVELLDAGVIAFYSSYNNYDVDANEDTGRTIGYGVWTHVTSLVGIQSILNADHFQAGDGQSIEVDYEVHSQLSDSEKTQYENMINAAGSTVAFLEQRQASNSDANGDAANNSAANSDASDNTASPSANIGKAVDDVGFIIAPQISIEYDDGFLHGDINFRYMHSLTDVDYFGSESDGTISDDITYTKKSGPLAFYVGFGLGINF